MKIWILMKTGNIQLIMTLTIKMIYNQKININNLQIINNKKKEGLLTKRTLISIYINRKRKSKKEKMMNRITN